MSKIYDRYIGLKEKDNDKIYLFLCGNFYIALDSDAIMLNELFDLKLTKFSNLCDKCGFPKSSIEKYESMLNKNNINYILVEDNDNSIESIIKKVQKLLNDYEIDNFTKEELINHIDIIKELIMEIKI